MKEVQVEIPVVGTFKYRGLFPENMTNDEIIEKTIKLFNGSSKNTVAYKQLITGSIVNFPVNFAKVKEV